MNLEEAIGILMFLAGFLGFGYSIGIAPKWVQILFISLLLMFSGSELEEVSKR